METHIEVKRTKGQPPRYIYLEYWNDDVGGEMLIEECTTRSNETQDSDDLVFTTKQDTEFIFRSRGGEAIIETGEADDIPNLKFPSGPSAVLDENLRQLCERE